VFHRHSLGVSSTDEKHAVRRLTLTRHNDGVKSQMTYCRNFSEMMTLVSELRGLLDLGD